LSIPGESLPMDRRPLGSSGIEVSRVALGGHEYLADGRSRGFNEDLRLAVTPGWIGKDYGGPRRSAVLDAAWAAGINFLDVTIDSEKEALGRNLETRPPPYPVCVQTRPEGMCYSYDPANRRMTDYAQLEAEVRRGLALLRRERLDFLNIGILRAALDGDPSFLAKMARNLDRLKREGLIRFAVADCFSGEATYLAQIACGGFDAVNVDLNLADRGPLRRVLPAAREAGLGVIAREAFLKGALFDIGASVGCLDRRALARMALKWVLEQDVDTVVVGVADAAQLQDAVAAAATPRLDAGDRALMARIEASAACRDYVRRKDEEFYGRS
jgi:aryl-alcohol dehydrogenase-like predicted oxidoreductase